MSTYVIYNDKSKFIFDTLALCKGGDIQLAGGSYNNVGRIDLCVNGSWGTICGNSFDNKDASVACRQLGYSSFGKLYHIFQLICFKIVIV